MTIEPINGLNKVDGPGKAKKTGKTSRPSKKSDSVSVSSEAKTRLEKAKYAKIVTGTSDVRADKVAEMRQKYGSGNYLTDKVADKIAEKIIESLGIK